MLKHEIRSLIEKEIENHYEFISRRSFKINLVKIKDESKKWCYNRFIRKSY